MAFSGRSNSALYRAYDVAQLQLEQNLTQREIASRLNISASSVSRLLRLARNQRIITESLVHPEELRGQANVTPEEIQGAEEELESTFKLRKALVIAVPQELSGKGHFDHRRDDDLARKLGAAAGRYLAGLLRGGDAIGIGSGRSVHAMVPALKARGLHVGRLTIVSLAAGTAVYQSGSGQLEVVSASDSASMVARALNTTDVILQRGKAYSRPDSRRHEQLEWTWNVDDQGAVEPDIAVTGLGAIAEGVYNCFDQLRHELPPESQELADEMVAKAESIRKEMQKRKLLAWGAEFFPLADILARPFVVDPPRAVIEGVGVKRFQSLRTTLQQMLRQVFVNSTPPGELAKLRHVVLVAGGVRKAFPVWHFLVKYLNTESAAWCHSLVTDYWTAQDLIAIAVGMTTEEREMAATRAGSATKNAIGTAAS